QVGGEVTTGVMLQDNATLLLKPFRGATVTVEVADTPAATDAGARFVALTVKSAARAAALNATVCITQLPPATTAVASQLPTAEVIWCSALSPFGWVRATVVKPVPGPLMLLDTVAPATISSVGVVVVQAPLSARLEVPEAPAVVSSGLAISRPWYSSTRTSGAGAAPLNVTVTSFGLLVSPAIFLAK